MSFVTVIDVPEIRTHADEVINKHYLASIIKRDFN